MKVTVRGIYAGIFVRAVWLGVILAVAAGCVRDEEPQGWALQPGDALPAFAVETLNGEVVTDESFADCRGAIVLFSTGCADCRRELPRLEQDYRQLCMLPEGAGFRLICISRAEPEEQVARFWRQNDLTMPVAAVPDRSVYDLFAASGVPRLFLVDHSVITASYLETLPQSPFSPHSTLHTPHSTLHTPLSLTPDQPHGLADPQHRRRGAYYNRPVGQP